VTIAYQKKLIDLLDAGLCRPVLFMIHVVPFNTNKVLSPAYASVKVLNFFIL